MQEKEFIKSALAIARDAAIGNPAYRFTGVKLALEVEEGIEHFSPCYRELNDNLKLLEKKGALIEIGRKVEKMGGVQCWGNEYVFKDVDHPAVLEYLGIQSPEVDKIEREFDLLQRSTVATEMQAKEAQRQSKLAKKQSKTNLCLSIIAVVIAIGSLVVSIVK